MIDILVLAGPTAVGKTEYSIALANELDGEIVSADSMQLYKYMDIGSAKPTTEERAAAPHHLVDFADPREPFSVAEYRKLAGEAIANIAGRGKLPIVSGGTGLYVNSLIFDMDFAAPPDAEGYRKSLESFSDLDLHAMLAEKSESLAGRIHPNNRKKVIRALEVLEVSGEEMPDFSRDLKPSKDFKPVLIGLTRDREELYERTNKRVDALMEAGLADEVLRLMSLGLTADDISMKGIGYKEIIGALNGEYSIEEAADLVKKNTRHYAKRQLTWFKRYENMRWFNLSDYDTKEAAEREILDYARAALNL